MLYAVVWEQEETDKSSEGSTTVKKGTKSVSWNLSQGALACTDSSGRSALSVAERLGHLPGNEGLATEKEAHPTSHVW